MFGTQILMCVEHRNTNVFGTHMEHIDTNVFGTQKY